MRRERWPFRTSVLGLIDQAKLAARGIPMELEYRFHPARRWRFDIAFPSLKLALEYQGLYLSDLRKGGHQTIRGLKNDWERLREAQLLGWMVLPFSPDDTRTGEALNVMVRAIKAIRLKLPQDADC